MYTELLYFVNFIVDGFLRIWPYLLLTIPLAVATQLSGASQFIGRALNAKPVIAIGLAAIVGAFSPFCSCTVIPLVAALLLSGVPLAPVMTFWIASPSMDPEIFFLSVAMIGWEMAVWRLIGTLVLSLFGGYVTHFLMSRHWLGEQVLRQRSKPSLSAPSYVWNRTVRIWQQTQSLAAQLVRPTLVTVNSSAGAGQGTCDTVSADSGRDACRVENACRSQQMGCGEGNGCCAHAPAETCDNHAPSPTQAESFGRRLAGETWSATLMVIQFMLIAFVLEAIIIRYVPAAWIAGLLGQDNSFAIVLAATIGIPVYTSNLTALPMIGGLLEQGMSPAAGLAFLIAGPTTTLPAMAAVWQLTTRRVFVLYVAFALTGAIVLGYIYQAVHFVNGTI